MPNMMNFLSDPVRRYKVMWLSDIDFAQASYKNQALRYLEDLLGSCEPGTTIAKIYYDVARQSHGIVLFNLAWPHSPEGEVLQTYRPPARQVQLEVSDVIDVEFSVEEPKELKDHGKTT